MDNAMTPHNNNVALLMDGGMIIFVGMIIVVVEVVIKEDTVIHMIMIMKMTLPQLFVIVPI